VSLHFTTHSKNIQFTVDYGYENSRYSLVPLFCDSSEPHFSFQPSSSFSGWVKTTRTVMSYSDTSKPFSLSSISLLKLSCHSCKTILLTFEILISFKNVLHNFQVTSTQVVKDGLDHSLIFKGRASVSVEGRGQDLLIKTKFSAQHAKNSLIVVPVVHTEFTLECQLMLLRVNASRGLLSSVSSFCS
jgi:hypothetical protein